MVHEPFEKHAKRFDAWFDRFPGNQIFPLEIACIKKAAVDTPRPWLEVGVGTGRFANALNINEGIDPSTAVLEIARSRGVDVRRGMAESLPYPDASFGGVFMIITLCFLDDPTQGIKECRRVLRPDGRFILGMVPADSAWGRLYQNKKEEGHIFYQSANLFTVSEAQALLEKNGFRIENFCSTLLLPPGKDAYPFSEPEERLMSDAGFVVIRAVRAD